MKANSGYREVLRRELDRRRIRNPRYSLRSFARDLDLSPSRLSDVLNQRYGLSRDAGEKIAQRLGLIESETEVFLNWIESEHARSKVKRLQAKKRLKGAGPLYSQLTLDQFAVISDWYHYALLELIGTRGFRNDPQWIARALGIIPANATLAIQRLKRLELIEEIKGVLGATDGYTTSSDGIPSEAVRNNHRQILEKAQNAVDFQSLQTRDLSTIVLAFDRSQMKEAKEMIRDFRRNFDRHFSTSKNKDSVYAMAMQFFRLDESMEKLS